jgi:hypothetical protein
VECAHATEPWSFRIVATALDQIVAVMRRAHARAGKDCRPAQRQRAAQRAMPATRTPCAHALAHPVLTGRVMLTQPARLRRASAGRPPPTARSTPVETLKQPSMTSSSRAPQPPTMACDRGGRATCGRWVRRSGAAIVGRCSARVSALRDCQGGGRWSEQPPRCCRRQRVRGAHGGPLSAPYYTTLQPPSPPPAHRHHHHHSCCHHHCRCHHRCRHTSPAHRRRPKSRLTPLTRIRNHHRRHHHYHRYRHRR